MELPRLAKTKNAFALSHLRREARARIHDERPQLLARVEGNTRP
jgi:hypothetical protein